MYVRQVMERGVRFTALCIVYADGIRILGSRKTPQQSNSLVLNRSESWPHSRKSFRVLFEQNVAPIRVINS